MYHLLPNLIDKNKVVLSKLPNLICIVEFYFSEFYDDDTNLLDYNCSKKEDFIKKGIGKK